MKNSNEELKYRAFNYIQIILYFIRTPQGHHTLNRGDYVVDE